jgi:predicted GNAT family acetyltransferase
MAIDMSPDRTAPFHQPERHRFVFVQEGGEAELTYHLDDGGALVVDHTFVPDAWRGQGIAALLMGACVDHAIREGLRIVPRCSYAVVFLDRHPELAAKVS